SRSRHPDGGGRLDQRRSYFTFDRPASTPICDPAWIGRTLALFLQSGQKPGPGFHMIDKLEEVERRFERLTAELSHPETLADSARLQRIARERSGLEKLVEAYRTLRRLNADLEEAEAMLASSDPEMRELGRSELPSLREKKAALEEEVQILLLPRDPNDDKDVLIELRAGAGGDEAALFAEEVMQMYLRYADSRGWSSAIVDLSPGNQGGVKEATLTLSGESVFSSMKYESGVHRVQRVPATETQGR